ncbi:hypothetical protein [Fusobacterium pseudoperiodonticum]|jgi:hypothetical protein|uniref:hypothetical protein n=1 Tax=Fusobacterium pseudoperiodonticum TaxID=2663009 RepID=UPI0028E4E4C0|nr:hypothetical protein [Fusobacterium pseudoperiodonticum]
MWNKAKKFQVITLKNGEKKVVIGYYDSEYLAFDYDEKDLKIFKSPIYNISIADVDEVEIKEFKKEISYLRKLKELQIITLKDKKQRVILSKPNGEYNAFDFEESKDKLTIYKIPSYEIVTSDIEKIDKPKKFKEIEYKNFMLAK